MPTNAQKRKTTVRRPAAVVAPAEDPKFEEMLSATQKILFIDSIVVDKQDFLNYYRLTSEAGTLNGYNKFFNAENQPYSVVYVNELGNKCWFSLDGSLYTADFLNEQWSEPAPLDGLGRFQRTNYPFMLSDGLTLYFAAISAEGLGGLDIYLSRYDSESEKFLLAENIGLPFNSDANDYMYAVDEFNNIGYFATDRRQPEGKVCIYTFVPNQKRVTYSTDDTNEGSIRSFAKIERIADTWGDGAARQEALERIAFASTLKEKKEKKGQDFIFIVNDDVVYTKPTDFRNAENYERLEKLNEMRKTYQNIGNEINKARTYYATKAQNSEKANLRAELLSYEQEYYQLETEIREMEKTIRLTEMEKIQKPY